MHGMRILLFALGSLFQVVATAQYLDPTFGTAGVVRLDVDGSFDQFFEVVTQPDGRIVAAGHANVNNDLHGLVARFTTGGAVDPTFNGIGHTLVHANGTETEFTGVALQADGRIVCSGTVGVGSARSAAAFRFNTDGTPDATFGTGGVVLVGLPSSYAEDVTLTPDGGVVIAGAAGGNFLVARFTPGGVLDTDFNGDGWTTLDLGGNERFYSVAAQSDGGVVVAGFADDPAGTLWAKRITATGDWDAAFGNGGSVVHEDGGMAYDVFVGADDAILLGGYAHVIGSYSEAVNYMLDSDGTGIGAIATETLPDVQGISTLAHGGWLLPDGRAIVGALEGEDIVLIGLLPTGSFDLDFGTLGLMRATGLEVDGGQDDDAGLWVEPSGRTLFCGRTNTTGDGDAFIAAFATVTTAITERIARQVRLMPNPATDQVRIDAPMTVVSARAWQADGRAQAVELGTDRSLHLTGWSPGLWMIELRFADGTVGRVRLVKQ